jgi:hypothetical protein
MCARNYRLVKSGLVVYVLLINSENKHSQLRISGLGYRELWDGNEWWELSKINLEIPPPPTDNVVKVYRQTDD